MLQVTFIFVVLLIVSWCLFDSGAITKHFTVAKKLMANFVLDGFFNPLQVKRYLYDKIQNHLTAEYIGMCYPSWDYYCWDYYCDSVKHPLYR